jgi:hypothetical protein
MGSKARRADFVNLVAQEISSGIDRGLQYWLGRIELEVVDGSLSYDERLSAIEQIIQEYKQIASGVRIGCASA